MGATTIFSVAFGLPLLLDRRFLRLGQWVLAFRTDTFRPARDRTARAIVYHAGWTLFFLGWAPFIWEVTRHKSHNPLTSLISYRFPRDL